MAKVALLIGVSEYGLGLNPLPVSVKDVQAIAKVLQHPEMGGFAAADIQKLENPDPQKMQEAIEGLFSDRRKEDLILLYFSGHGIKDETGKLYLATSLTRKNPQGRLVKATAVPANFIHNVMSDSRSKRQVVILDCCFSGAFAEGLSAKDDGSVDIYTQLGGEGRVVLTSSTSTQYSFQQEGDSLSIYTRYVVEGIETGAADQDNDGVISIDELHEYAKKKVKEAAPAMQPEIYAVKEGFKIRLAKAPIGDPKLRYRQEVERFASRGVISAIGRNTLDLKRQSLRLSSEEATIIEAEVLEPYQEYQKRLQRYEQVLFEEINKQYPLNQDTQKELKAFQEALGLKDRDVEPIFARVVPLVKSSSLINEASADSKSTTPLKPEITPPENYSSNTAKKMRSMAVVLFATILGLTGIIYGIYALTPYFYTKLNEDIPKTSSSSSEPSTPKAVTATKPPNEDTPSRVLPGNNVNEPRNKPTSTALPTEAEATLRAYRQRQDQIRAESEAALREIRKRQADAEAAAEKQRQFDAARLLCMEKKQRYQALFEQGAVGEGGVKKVLNDNNCSDYGITWP
ncbi:hypothetical protein A4S05_21890 [Nostoc sp. KVJ20]|uniref:caspase family protein n=1 Tax=Nostoc sp. KVJ20 TaxID=457944 RepID=UPI00083D9D53|nr:caspase family protein [Nostoc sp. KVJ20]ODH02914.1 hypothetical protein A4S05_21890 [Nostoc sp. KVJ20]